MYKYKGGNKMENESTKQLVEELVNREGVEELCISPCDEVLIKINDINKEIKVIGPARILIIID